MHMNCIAISIIGATNLAFPRLKQLVSINQCVAISIQSEIVMATMHYNFAGKIERQFIKETSFRQIKILPIANFQLIAKY